MAVFFPAASSHPAWHEQKVYYYAVLTSHRCFIGRSFLQIPAPAAPVSMATVARTAKGIGSYASAARVTGASVVTCRPWPSTCPSPPGTSPRAWCRNTPRPPLRPRLRPPLKSFSLPQSPPLLKLRPSWNRGNPSRVKRWWRYCGRINRWAGVRLHSETNLPV